MWFSLILLVLSFIDFMCTSMAHFYVSHCLIQFFFIGKLAIKIRNVPNKEQPEKRIKQTLETKTLNGNKYMPPEQSHQEIDHHISMPLKPKGEAKLFNTVLLAYQNKLS